jgi:hypothetical protein
MMTLVQTCAYSTRTRQPTITFPQRTIIQMPASSTTPNNPFALAHFKSFEETREVNGQKTTYRKATGRLKDIRKFLNTEIKLHHAEIVYASSLVNSPLMTSFDDDDDDETAFIGNFGGNLNFDYLGSNQELASLFKKCKLELVF